MEQPGYHHNGTEIMQLTKNFSLEEFLVSQTAERHDIDMTPPQHIIDNLRDLCVTVLQPIRTVVDSPLIISSGYRPPELNSLIGGSPTSAHRFGRAADFGVVGLSAVEVCDLVIDLDLVWDQLILEFRRWVHIGISDVLPRQQALTAVRQNGATVYLAGIVE
jgi:hypothetical protein